MRRIVSKINENIRRAKARRFVRQTLRPAIDSEKFLAIRERCTGSEQYYKYFKTDQYMVRNAERVLRLGLDKSPPQRVLDLGCGFGYFMLCCKLCGHETVGVDLPSPDLFDPVLEVFDLRKVAHRIEPLHNLPPITGGPFDLITAFEVCFDRLEHSVWGLAEWKWLLRDLASRTAPGGRLVLKFNGPRFHPELRRYFKQLGASIEGRFVTLDDFPAKLAAAP